MAGDFKDTLMASCGSQSVEEMMAQGRALLTEMEGVLSPAHGRSATAAPSSARMHVEAEEEESDCEEFSLLPSISEGLEAGRRKAGAALGAQPRTPPRKKPRPPAPSRSKQWAPTCKSMPQPRQPPQPPRAPAVVPAAAALRPPPRSDSAPRHPLAAAAISTSPWRRPADAQDVVPPPPSAAPKPSQRKVGPPQPHGKGKARPLAWQIMAHGEERWRPRDGHAEGGRLGGRGGANTWWFQMRAKAQREGCMEYFLANYPKPLNVKQRTEMDEEI
eukprot:TRINITY_DN6782_c0_g1_i1.p1 TRINITY_DN6782_c0_g1~~TRINITY_DN6782_c0_g1_i1.p1  ORF type:complete len:274 (+),score=50.35 TRINITY_DN6782_c0_g1_i1:238-1059(+)